MLNHFFEYTGRESAVLPERGSLGESCLQLLQLKPGRRIMFIAPPWHVDWEQGVTAGGGESNLSVPLLFLYP